MRIDGGYTNIVSKQEIKKRKTELAKWLQILSTNDISLSSPYYPEFLHMPKETIVELVNLNKGFIKLQSRIIIIPKRCLAGQNKALDLSAINNFGASAYSRKTSEFKLAIKENIELYKTETPNMQTNTKDDTMEKDGHEKNMNMMTMPPPSMADNVFKEENKLDNFPIEISKKGNNDQDEVLVDSNISIGILDNIEEADFSGDEDIEDSMEKHHCANRTKRSGMISEYSSHIKKKEEDNINAL